MEAGTEGGSREGGKEGSRRRRRREPEVKEGTGPSKKKKKKRKILPCATLWINLESVVLSEKSPSQKEFTEVNGYPEESIS